MKINNKRSSNLIAIEIVIMKIIEIWEIIYVIRQMGNRKLCEYLNSDAIANRNQDNIMSIVKWEIGKICE